MLESLLQQTTIPLLEQVTAFGQRRHQVLAGNIANIDTPDYKTRDLPVQDFEKALQKAVVTRRENLQPGPLPTQQSLADGQLSWGQMQFPEFTTPTPAGQTFGLPTRRISDNFPAQLHEVKDSPARNLTFTDGGNRSIERESMEMTKNTALQSFAIEVMISQMRMLETVISERVV